MGLVVFILRCLSGREHFDGTLVTEAETPGGRGFRAAPRSPHPMILSPSPPRRSVHRIMAHKIMGKHGAGHKEPSLPIGRALPHPSPLPLGEGASSPAARRSERSLPTTRCRRFPLSQRERAGVRESGHANPTALYNTKLGHPSVSLVARQSLLAHLESAALLTQ